MVTFNPEVTLGAIAVILTLLGAAFAFWWRLAQMESKINIVFGWFIKKFNQVPDQEVNKFFTNRPRQRRRKRR